VITAKGVVSRRNQDGTFILMKMQETGFFYKITGLAAAVWGELETAKNEDALVAHFSALWPAFAEGLKTDIPVFITGLLEKGLIVAVHSESAPFRTEPLMPKDIPAGYNFGKIEEFDLERIETEVLNESVYLDVFAGSDLRLKHDVRPIEGALAKVSALNGITYRWNPATAPVTEQSRHAGLIAQDVAAAMPELVRADAERGFLAVEYSKLSGYLVEAIKELRDVVENQSERIRELEARLR
jgi:hypothetical protein